MYIAVNKFLTYYQVFVNSRTAPYRWIRVLNLVRYQILPQIIFFKKISRQAQRVPGTRMVSIRTVRGTVYYFLRSKYT
eukprot:SAG31_NODE_1038_length_10218_cov_16.418223_9_plen_78_part_00